MKVRTPSIPSVAPSFDANSAPAGPGGGGYTNEEAQDAVGGILVDTDTIDLAYNDGTPSITAAARVQMSITSDSSGLKLSGDSASPGNTKLYGTNGSGTKGWYDQPSGSGMTYSQVLSAAYLT